MNSKTDQAVFFEMNSDWPGFALCFRGEAAVIASHCRLVHYDPSNNHIWLSVADGHREFTDRASVNTLRDALVPHFGETVRATIGVCRVPTKTEGEAISAAVGAVPGKCAVVLVGPIYEINENGIAGPAAH